MGSRGKDNARNMKRTVDAHQKLMTSLGRATGWVHPEHPMESGPIDAGLSSSVHFPATAVNPLVRSQTPFPVTENPENPPANYNRAPNSADKVLRGKTFKAPYRYLGE